MANITQNNDKNMLDFDLIDRYKPLIGEFAWHNITVDPTIKKVSEDHYNIVLDVLEKHRLRESIKGLKILEVASYAHTTGYMLAEKGALVTLFDISAQTLEFGLKMAGKIGDNENVTRVAGDFHDFPFEDGVFDCVYICSALHHTLHWKKVLDEMFRVLVPGGIMFLENEPCKRAACFYAFRTNRENSFTAFEKELHRLGVLRTFAEPYLGSRPETLFGMVENQQIPLDDLISEIKLHADIQELELSPEICMGKIEHKWINARDSNVNNLSRIVAESLVNNLSKALNFYSEKDKGLGFNLPTEQEIQYFARRVAKTVKGLPKGKDDYRIGLAKLFGASVKVVLQKRSVNNDLIKNNQNLFRRDCFPRNGVLYSFTQDLNNILIDNASVLPSIQKENHEIISSAFPTEDWIYSVAHNDIKVLSLNADMGEICIRTKGHNTLVILRIYVSSAISGGYKVAISCHDKLLFSFDVWQDDSILFTDVIVSPNTENVSLYIKKSPLKGDCGENRTGSVQIVFAAAFKL